MTVTIVDRRIPAVVAILVAAALVAAACGSPDSEEHRFDAATTPTTPTTGSIAGGGSSDEGSASSLPFGDEEPPPGVIVGHAIGSMARAHRAPTDESVVVAELSNPTPVGGPLAFRLVDPIFDSGAEWLEVYLPIRPNGSTGWIRSSELELSRNPFRIEIDTGDHRLDVYRGGVQWLTTTVAIGTGDTPTPIGDFYIIELLQPPSPDGAYGPFAFGLSGFSETLTSFAGGDGVVGIHGTNDPAALGSDVSHGCVRVANDVIESLAGVIPLGTPVTITT